MHVISRTSSRFAYTSRSRIGAVQFFGCAVAIAVSVAACASSSKGSVAGSTSAAASASSGPKSSPNLITADEIARVNVQNAYEAVQKLRPAMLRPRQIASANGYGGVSADAPTVKGTNTVSGQLVVYMDGTRLGDVEQLRQISSTTIASLRYYSASEAQTKWGSGHPGGAVEVLTKR